MTDPLLTIGAFARAAGLTPSALRHYDEVGLLPPADVDASTGYRYYTPHLVRRARLIARMREIGVPIDVMRTVLGDEPDAARTALRAFVAEQADRTARAEDAIGEILTAAAAGRAQPLPTLLHVDGPELAAALRQVQAAADTDRRSPLGSVLLDAGAGALEVVATNRYWLATRTIALSGAHGAGRAVVGLEAAGELAARLDREHGVDVALGRTGLSVGGEPVAVRDVAYPDHRAVLDGLEPVTVRAVVDRRELMDTIEAAARAEIDLTFGQDAVDVAAPDGATTRMPAAVTGVEAAPALTVRLGAALIVRALSAAVGPRVVVAVSALERQPIAVRSPYQRGFLALVMPIRVA